ncbi:MAG TPA: hypothetical protein VH374_04580 [Polyangia bacterium]|nr:hypothetical protein [Polyangia bacterium]
MAKIPPLLLPLLLVTSTVFAQGPGTPPPPAPVPAATPVATPPAAGGQVDVSVKQLPTLTPQEMLNQGQAYFQTMNDTLKRIQVLEDTAKNQKDIIKLNCVKDKLVQGKVNLNLAEQSMTALQESIARADEGARTHEFTRLTIVNQKVLVLGAEAENCIGEDLSFVGATRVDVEIDPNIPQTDPTQPPIPVTPVDRPPPASNYQSISP